MVNARNIGLLHNSPDADALSASPRAQRLDKEIRYDIYSTMNSYFRKHSETAFILSFHPPKKNHELASGNTNLALAVFGCLWESLIVFANDWVHFGV